MTASSNDRRRGSQPVDNEWLPDWCPTWCDRGHAEAFADGGDWTAAQEHVGGGHGGYLHLLLNPVDQRVVRPGGAGWEMDIRQRPMYPNGLLDVATINLEVRAEDYERVMLNLTPGEALTLARQLTALVDRVEL